jgi:hypothetical protein
LSKNGNTPATIDAPTNEKLESGLGRQVRRGGRRRSLDENVRYFIGRPGDGDGKPMLEQEVASEPEALVIAFKNDSLVYFISEYRVTQRIEGNQVLLEKVRLEKDQLEKEPAAPSQRVSNLNGS